MSRPAVLELRINRVLTSIAPLTAGQIVKAVHPTDAHVVYATLYRLCQRGVLTRVPGSAAQRHISAGHRNAYALENC
ncbi:hypothetical protein [Deinococcus altitudinis]|uniref:hypothetical protein n=1 Tax=Deinococcus altitudinis TaxID=468914 RepID=UPI003892B46F